VQYYQASTTDKRRYEGGKTKSHAIAAASMRAAHLLLDDSR